jgi:hypothetical protein
MRIFIFGMILFCLCACSGERGAPKKLIPQKKMEDIIWDMTQADQFATQYLKKDSSVHNLKAETMKMYDEIFAIHHVTKDEFKENFQYYTSHPELTKMIFDSLFARGTRERGDIYKNPLKPPAQAPAKQFLPLPVSPAPGRLKVRTDSLRKPI